MGARSTSAFALRIAAGVVALMMLTVLVAAFGVFVELRASTRTQDEIARYTDDLVLVERLRFNAEEEIATSRRYIFTGEAASLQSLMVARDVIARTLHELRDRALTTAGARLADDVDSAHQAYESALDNALAAHGSATADIALAKRLDAVVQPTQEDLKARLQLVVDYKRSKLGHVLERGRAAASEAVELLALAAAVACAIGAGLGFLLARRLTALYQGERRAVSAATEAVRQREDVLAIVSHDLRNPLAVIEMAALSIAREGAGARMLTLANRIRRASDRIERLIRDLLDAAQLSDRKLSVDVKVLDVSVVLAETIDMFAEGASAAGTELIVNVPPGLSVHADQGRLSQALANLISNAIKHTPADGRVTVSAEDSDVGVHFSVVDTGAGIPPDVAEHIFDRFWTRSAGGVGLGLFIARGVVESHGGRIWVVSAPGRGSEFHFVIPGPPVTR